jgi:putative resolvase
MKLSDYAKQQGVRYETAWRWFQEGKIKGHRVGAHTIMIDEGLEVAPTPAQKVVAYARVVNVKRKVAHPHWYWWRNPPRPIKRPLS